VQFKKWNKGVCDNIEIREALEILMGLFVSFLKE
jgi:hypothetical protein